MPEGPRWRHHARVPNAATATHGFIVVDAQTGARLRRGPAVLLAAHVLDCSGAFRTGDRVHIVVRGRDGGQGVLACGTVCCDATDLARACAAHTPVGRADAESAGPKAVMRPADVTLLWTART